MDKYEIGKPFDPATRSWPEVSLVNFRGGAAELLLFMERPTPAEVKAVKSSPCEFGLYHEGDQIVFCYRFIPGIPWGDAPFTIHRVSEPELVVPDPAALSPESRALLHITLVDAKDGVIQALRVVTLSPGFTRALYAAIEAQASIPWDRDAYDRTLNRLLSRFTPSLAPACQHYTRGGE